MALDLVATTLFLGTVAMAFRGGLRPVPNLPADDLPPRAARVRIPRGPGLRRYVGRGLDEIDAYLAEPVGYLTEPDDWLAEPDDIA